jgi:hypothetical protein
MWHLNLFVSSVCIAQVVRRSPSLKEKRADCSAVVLVWGHVHALGGTRNEKDGEDNAWGQDACREEDCAKDHGHLLFSGERFEPVADRGDFLEALCLLA